LDAPEDALVAFIEIKANIRVISVRGEAKKRLVEEA